MNPTFQFIEPLEPRVAPAILVNGGNLLGGAGNPDTGQTSSGGNTVTLVKVLSGQALVFFDASGNGEITGISVGKHTKLDITGDIFGDIVTNLGPNGRLTDSDNNPLNGEDGGILLPYRLAGLTTHPLQDQLGSVGRIIAGGGASNINVAGDLSGIYTGDGIFKTTTTGSVPVDTGNVDYNSINPGLDHIFNLLQSAAQSSAVPSVKKVTVGVANQLAIFAGDGTAVAGGAGNAGGSISDVNVLKSLSGDLDTPAIHLQAGDGAAGTTGGAGGAIMHFTDASSTSYVKLQTGNGGAGSVLGGAGGSFTSSAISSSAVRYEIQVGNGGAGTTGGVGGSIASITFSDAVSGANSLLATGDFTGDGVPDVLLINTISGNATLSAGVASNPNATEAPYQIVLHPSASGGGTTPFIAPAPNSSVPTGVVAADLNGDGLLDFVVSYSSSKTLGVFLNDGGGNFTASTVALAASPTRIAAGNYTNSGHVDIAVLASGDIPGTGGTFSSQIYIAENNGAGAFNTVSAPTTFAGVATDFVGGQLDNTGGDDLAVGFKSGSVDTFLANAAAGGTPFTLASSLKVFSGPIGNLDISGGGGATSLLAFTPNMNANVAATPTSTPSVTPFVQLLNVTSAGDLTSGIGFTPADAAPVAAHFIGSANAIGVVSATGITIYTPAQNSYAAVAAITSDGALTDFATNVTGEGFQLVASGASMSRFFETSGTLDNLGGVGTLLPFDIPGQPYVIGIKAGDGGAGGSLDGGDGGSINHLSYTQTVGAGVEQAGARINISFTTGDGGASSGGTGGAGGVLSKSSLNLNPADLTGEQDSTTLAVLTSGTGGDGATGGHGGEIHGVTSTSVFDQTTAGGTARNSVAVQLVAGDGGTGTAAAGGDGGGIKLSAHKTALDGVTFFDPISSTPFAPGLLVQSGQGGNGATTGGNGGDLVNIQAQNSVVGTSVIAFNELASAIVTSGGGGQGGSGAGGKGGAITGLNAAVASQPFSYYDTNGVLRTIHSGGSLLVSTGAGGASTASTGGAGGTISKSTAASVDGDGYRDDNAAYFGSPATDPYQGLGVLVRAGAGAAGATGGGKGGGIQQLDINSPSAPDVYAAILLGGNGGNGGDATSAGNGGKGGSISGVTQTKDVNSSLSLLQGGEGGTGAGGAGGKGGSVKHVDTVGFVGLPATATTHLGVFNEDVTSPLVAALFPAPTAPEVAVPQYPVANPYVPQGIFAGRGADGAVAGSVIDIVARQIAAIGAAVDANGLFGVANAVSNVQADLIGYEYQVVHPGGAIVPGEPVQDNVFTSTVPGDSPSQAAPIDGFILASTVSAIQTSNDARTAAFTFNG